MVGELEGKGVETCLTHFKILRGSSEGEAHRGQYLLVVGI